MKKYAFYITNHGFGHASRNIPLIEGILEREPESIIYVKTDAVRCEFMRRNLKAYIGNICFCEEYQDIGLILQKNSYEIDAQKLKKVVAEEQKRWHTYRQTEVQFLKTQKIDLVVSDIIPWILLAAQECGVSSVLLCNFTWYEMYKDFLPEELCLPYREAYRCADKIFVYEFANPVLDTIYPGCERVSMLCRKVNEEKAAEIAKQYPHPIVFVSVGKSIEMHRSYDVSDAPGTYLITAGVQLSGNNVIQLPENLINTQDYLKACDYAIIKGGWSTMAEVLLNKRKSAVILRCSNSEDDAVRQMIHNYACMQEISFENLTRMNEVLEKIENIKEDAFARFKDDKKTILNYIIDHESIRK